MCPSCYLEIMSRELFANSCYVQAQFPLCTLHAKWNMFLTYVEVQATLFRLFVLGCIHLLSSWSWSAILFVPDPLPASTIQMHEGETLTRRMRRKPPHLGMTKTFKACSDSQLFLCNSAYTDKQHMEKDILYFRQHVLFVFLWTLRFVEPPQNEVLASSSCQMACIEILPPLMRLRGKTNFLKERGSNRITVDNVCATSY